MAGNAAEKKMKVAFVYNAAVGDFGWYYSQDKARKLTDKALDWVTTSRLEDVKPGAQAERVFIELCEDDYKVIIAASLDYQADILKVASKYPDVKFLICAGDAFRDPNVESYFPQRTQLWYMMGQIAGKLTKTNTIGIIAAINVPLILQLNNAWLLGARSVNPNVKERIIFVNSFFDPAAERDAALSLIDAGADVLCQGTNTPAHVQAAQEKGVLAMSQWEDMRKFGPDAYLTGEVYHWEKYYIPTLKAIRAGTWKPSLNYPDWTSGILGFSDFSPKVTDDIKSILKETQAKLKEDPMFFWKGPLYDNDGKLRVEAGKKITDEQMANMSWHVAGVITSLKNK
jgi:basic membrane protein A